MPEAHAQSAHGEKKGHYTKFFIMIGLSFVAMYALMYAMVDAWSNVHANWNQFYMAGLMAAAMVVIELAVMGGMYYDKRLNQIILGAGVVSLVVFWMFIRKQTAISDAQFLKSMIPHHASALLMCQQASLTDAEIRALCQNILSGQQEQIEQMNAKLKELAR